LLLVTKPFVDCYTEVGYLLACICGAEVYLATNIAKYQSAGSAGTPFFFTWQWF
jgi:hypothetical protein